MDPLPTTPAPPGARTSVTSAKVVYVLYLLSFVFGITALVGVVMAYVYVGDAPEWLRSHHRLQIRTFWLGVLFALVGIALSVVGIGFLVVGFTVVWILVRCVKGLRFLDRGEAYPDPRTWLW